MVTQMGVTSRHCPLEEFETPRDGVRALYEDLFLLWMCDSSCGILYAQLCGETRIFSFEATTSLLQKGARIELEAQVQRSMELFTRRV